MILRSINISALVTRRVNTHPKKSPGPVTLLLIITFIILANTSYVGPESSLVILSSYLSFNSSLKYNNLEIIKTQIQICVIHFFYLWNESQFNSKQMHKTYSVYIKISLYLYSAADGQAIYN